MRTLDWNEFLEENRKNNNEIRNSIKRIYKTPGKSVPDNTVKYLETILNERSHYTVGDLDLSYKIEKVIVKNVFSKEDFKDENKEDYFEIEEKNGQIYTKEYLELYKLNIQGKNELYDVYTSTEASELWGLNESTVRKAIQNQKFKLGIDYRKSGRITIITRKAMERVFGEIKK